MLAILPGSTRGAQAFAVSAKSGGSLTMVGGAVQRSKGVGILLSTASAALSGALVLDTQTRYQLGGRAVSVQDKSSLTAVRSAFIGSSTPSATPRKAAKYKGFGPPGAQSGIFRYGRSLADATIY